MKTNISEWIGLEIAEGRYRVLGKVGQGSMGHIYCAFDHRLQTEVVLKFPVGHELAAEDQDFRERFNREIRSLVALSHPHIVKIIDVGEFQDFPIVVMQYLAGGSLKNRMATGPAGELEAVRDRWGELHVDYPDPNLWNEHPYYILEVPWSDPAHREAAAEYLKFLMGETMQRRALEHGFRPGNPEVSVRFAESPLIRHAARGVRIELPRMCEPPRAEVVKSLLAAYGRLELIHPTGLTWQNLHWDAGSGHLICVQNVIAGRGWQLDELDLTRAIADGRADGPGVRVRRLTFSPHDELEGYWPLASHRGFFAVARRRDNLFVGAFRPTEPRPSPPDQGRSGAGIAPGAGRPARVP